MEILLPWYGGFVKDMHFCIHCGVRTTILQSMQEMNHGLLTLCIVIAVVVMRDCCYVKVMYFHYAIDKSPSLPLFDFEGSR